MLSYPIFNKINQFNDCFRLRRTMALFHFRRFLTTEGTGIFSDLGFGIFFC